MESFERHVSSLLQFILFLLSFCLKIQLIGHDVFIDHPAEHVSPFCRVAWRPQWQLADRS